MGRREEVMHRAFRGGGRKKTSESRIKRIGGLGGLREEETAGIGGVRGDVWGLFG